MRKLPKQMHVVSKEKFVQKLIGNEHVKKTPADNEKGRKARSWQVQYMEKTTKKPTRW